MGFEELEVELKRLCVVVEEKSELKYLTEILEKNNVEVLKNIDELKEDMGVKQQNQRLACTIAFSTQERTKMTRYIIQNKII